MTTIKVLIIDDEQLARDLLKSYLAKDSRLEIVGECSNGFEGVLAIQELKPDLVFLDIQMPKITGFEMLELLTDRPVIIFSTAYEEFAIRAFEANAVDYLLKPYPLERVQVAVEKALKQIQSGAGNKEELENLSQTHDENSGLLTRIVVKSGSKIKIIPVETIDYLESEDDFVMIYCKEGHFLKQKTMKFFENHLDPKKFIRIHRSCLVNSVQIAEIQQYGKESWMLLTKNGAKLKISKSGYLALKEFLST
ncbi:MAG: LytTR family transcriptional regulator DNA-binding domain-containing protein [Prolixibacteraceae bacterium]|jgi:two-component system LytT family response regulator|nr:LytTR family transcriptional regulator DNA-binding domain-containing protein [Prolixibacteraceae bacterium]